MRKLRQLSWVLWVLDSGSNCSILGAAVIPWFGWGRIHFSSLLRGYWQDSFPGKHWDQGLGSSGCWQEAALSSLPHGLLHRAAQKYGGRLHQSKQRESQIEWVSASRMEVTLFRNQIARATFYLCCCILPVKSKLLGPGNTQGLGITWGLAYWEAGIMVAIQEFQVLPFLPAILDLNFTPSLDITPLCMGYN